MKATQRGTLGGMIVICVEPGTEVAAEDGSTAVVDDTHTVVSGKGALYVTPKIYHLLKGTVPAEQNKSGTFAGVNLKFPLGGLTVVK